MLEIDKNKFDFLEYFVNFFISIFNNISLTNCSYEDIYYIFNIFYIVCYFIKLNSYICENEKSYNYCNTKINNFLNSYSDKNTPQNI